MGRREVAVAVGGLSPNRPALNTRNTARRIGGRRFMVLHLELEGIDDKGKSVEQIYKTKRCAEPAPRPAILYTCRSCRTSPRTSLRWKSASLGRRWNMCGWDQCLCCGRSEPAISSVDGRVVRELRRIGKRIAIGVDGQLWLVLHLMIAGRLHWKAPKAKLAGRNALARLRLSQRNSGADRGRLEAASLALRRARRGSAAGDGSRRRGDL